MPQMIATDEDGDERNQQGRIHMSHSKLISLRMTNVPITAERRRRSACERRADPEQGAKFSGPGVHREGHARRQQHQHKACDPAVRRDHLDLAFYLEALPDDTREVVEHLRQVAAGFALRQDGGDEEARIHEGTPAKAFSASGSGSPKFCRS